MNWISIYKENVEGGVSPTIMIIGFIGMIFAIIYAITGYIANKRKSNMNQNHNP
ncbi:hypothetical protein LCGC14_2546100 [marine sediment metagenome]|uniref:Uncharacterized protein n=1 Tax=marine sediment metagenome TaxID=412755 RepID=A0A0F9AP85_9ZZZZ